MKIENKKLVYEDKIIDEKEISYRDINKIAMKFLSNEEISNDGSSIFLTKIIHIIKDECDTSIGDINDF